MAEMPATTVLAWNGPLSPPRRNGEIIFDALWQSRLFGMTMTLYESGAFRWEEFRDALIVAIASWEDAHQQDGDEYRYWDCWLEAFERLVQRKGLCDASELAKRLSELALRPPAHDHIAKPNLEPES